MPAFVPASARQAECRLESRHGRLERRLYGLRLSGICYLAAMLRRFRRDRLFHGAVVLLLALGIGSNTLVFSLLNELLLKPLPVRDPG